MERMKKLFFSLVSLSLVFAMKAKASEEDSHFLLRCDKVANQLTISDDSIPAHGLYEAEGAIKGDKVIDPVTLTKITEVGDRAYQKPKTKARYSCTVGAHLKLTTCAR